MFRIGKFDAAVKYPIQHILIPIDQTLSKHLQILGIYIRIQFLSLGFQIIQKDTSIEISGIRRQRQLVERCTVTPLIHGRTGSQKIPLQVLMIKLCDVSADYHISIQP